MCLGKQWVDLGAALLRLKGRALGCPALLAPRRQKRGVDTLAAQQGANLSAALRMRVRSALENWRRCAMAATSGLGGAIGDAFPVALRAPSNASPIAGETARFIGSLDSLDMIQDYLSTL